MSLALSHLPSLERMSALPIYAGTAAHMRALVANRRGDHAAVGVHASEAASQYRELGWPVHELRMRELGGVSLTIATASDPRTSLLSPREREIAELVAKGIPNKRLAEHLAVSRRTVEKHLTSIFGKLGLSNRTELTAVMIRKSLP